MRPHAPKTARCARLVLALAGLGLAAPAAAKGLNGHQLDVAVETEIPVVVGLSTTWEHPSRFRLKLSGGFMPGGYVDLTNAALVGMDVYSQSVADIIDAALKNSMVLHLRGGWRPFAARGFTVTAGYQYLGLGGDTADLSLFSEAADPALISAAQDVTGDLDIAIHDHMISAGLGYEWALAQDRLVLGTSLGFAYSLRAPSRAEPTRAANGTQEQEISDAVTVAAEDYLTYVFEEWVHLPMVGLSVGYRFR